MTLPPFDLFILSIAAMLSGLYLLIKSGEWIISAAVYIAKRWHVSPLLIGFTIVAFGTSLPELMVSILANLQGSPGISIGNVIGSNIANICLVIGVTGLVVTLTTQFTNLARDMVFMCLATILMAYFLFAGEIGRIAGGLMILGLIGYTALNYFMANDDDVPEEVQEDSEFSSSWQAYGMLLLGLFTVFLGAEILVRGAKVGAAVIGVPDAVIGLSVIALGTSLPELSTCLIAARRGLYDIVLGNIIGSNVFNILMIIGISSLIKPVEQGQIDPQLVSFDVWVFLGVTFLFSALLAVYRKIDKVVAIPLLVFYVLYNIFIYYQYIV